MSQTLVDYREHLARHISNQLILAHKIDIFIGLAEFLEVDSRLNNQQAIRCWVRKQVEEGLDVTQEPYTQLERMLINITPINDE